MYFFSFPILVTCLSYTFYSLSDGDFRVLELDHSSIANPLLFESSFLIGKELFPVSMVSPNRLNENSGSIIVFFEEFNFDYSLNVEALYFITLLLAADSIGLDGQFNMFKLLSFFRIVVHYIVGNIIFFSKDPFFTKLIFLNILFDIVPDSSWLDILDVNIIRHDIIESLVGKSSFSDEMKSIWSS